MKTKYLFLIELVIGLGSCVHSKNNVSDLQKRMDSLENNMANSYRPGFGDFMSTIQAHHLKLWFAGKNENWKLADFEIHEIMEAIDDIKTYQSERKESKQIEMLIPAIDSVRLAIEEKNYLLFSKNFTLLTNTCNSCHRSVNVEFNVVKIPETSPFSNQEFKTYKK